MQVAHTRKLAVSFAIVLVVGAAFALMDVPWSKASGAEGTVQLAADGNLATLTVDGIQPGDTVTRSVTIRNSSDGPVRLAFTEQADAATIQGGALQLAVTAGTRTVYTGRFGEMLDITQDMGTVPAGDAVTFRFTVSLSADVTFRPGEGSATASYAWSLTPV